MGGGQKSGVFDWGPVGGPRSELRKIPETFFYPGGRGNALMNSPTDHLQRFAESAMPPINRVRSWTYSGQRRMIDSGSEGRY